MALHPYEEVINPFLEEEIHACFHSLGQPADLPITIEDNMLVHGWTKATLSWCLTEASRDRCDDN